MKKQIEIFTAGCPICEPVVQLVKDTASDNNKIIIHNLSMKTPNAIIGIKKYKIKHLPAIVIDGTLLSCCKNIKITKSNLLNAGLRND